LEDRGQAEALKRLRDFSARDLTPHASDLLAHAKPTSLPLLVGLLGDLRVPCADAVEPLLVHPEGAVRHAAARTLGVLDPPPGPDRLVRALEDSRHEVRAASASALGRIGATAAVVIPLIRSLGDPHRSVAKAALDSLVRRRARRAVPALVDRALDPNSPIRLAALRALGSLGDEGAVDPLIIGLSDGDPGIRLAAAEGLRTLGSLRAAAPLRGLHKDTPAIAGVAKQALETAPSPEPSDVRWVEVRTVNGAGTPRGETEVIVTSAQGASFRGRTNADGVLRLSPVPAGSVTVHAGALPSPPR